MLPETFGLPLIVALPARFPTAGAPEIETLPETDGVPKAVEKATLPPVLTVPVTILSALSLWVVCFVQPVGAAVCWNSIDVPDGNASTPVRQSHQEQVAHQ